jgi:hypothetical protein
MKQIISFFLVIALLFSLIGCTHHPMAINPNPPQPNHFNPHWNPDPSKPMGETILLALLAVTIAATATVLLFYPKKVKLTPGGEKVKLLVHEEAPKSAKFLGDIETRSLLSAICVKNELRNRAARLGGNLVVVDNISPVGSEGELYMGSARVYDVP